MKHTLIVLGYVMVILALLERPVQAGFCCDIKRTSDGFLALRASPTAKSKLLYKMKAPEIVAFCLWGGVDKKHIDPKGKWIFGFYQVGRHQQPRTDKIISGWAYQRYIDNNDCG